MSQDKSKRAMEKYPQAKKPEAKDASSKPSTQTSSNEPARPDGSHGEEIKQQYKSIVRKPTLSSIPEEPNEDHENDTGSSFHP